MQTSQPQSWGLPPLTLRLLCFPPFACVDAWLSALVRNWLDAL